MKIQESAEMYLENILRLRNKQGRVRSIDIAMLSGYSKPSVSRAVGLLKKSGMIVVDPEGFITLTPDGERCAQKIYERHRTLSAFFENIGVSPETAATDACRIEHVISDETFEAICKHAGESKK